MYCPNCGKENPSQTKFCRSCGLGLDKIVQSLTEQLGDAAQALEIQNKKEKVERWLSILLGGLGVFFVGLILWGIIYKLIIGKGYGWEGFAFLAIVIGLVSALVLVIYRESLNEKAAKLASQPPQIKLTPTPTAKSLPESSFQPIGSVTEHTTELLVSEPRRDTKEL